MAKGSSKLDPKMEFISRGAASILTMMASVEKLVPHQHAHIKSIKAWASNILSTCETGEIPVSEPAADPTPGK